MENRRIYAVAAFFYIFILPLFFHPDIKTIFYQSQFLLQGVVNIYGFLEANPEKALLGPFVYPPLAYFLMGIIYLPVKFFAGAGFTQWLAMGNDAVAVDGIYQYLFAMKLPLLTTYFISGYLLTCLVDGKEIRRRLLLLWFFNPISIYTVGFMGQIDSLVVMTTILAVFYAKRSPYLASALLGIGALIKSYPLLLIPFFAVLVSVRWRDRIKVALPGFLVYFIGIAPYLTTPAFYESSLVSGLSQRIFQLSLDLGFGEKIPLIPLSLVIIFLIATFKHSGNLGKIGAYFLAVLVIIVVGVHFHPQWALWALPFLFLFLTRKGKRRRVIWFALALYILGWLATFVLIDDRFLTWGLISTFDSGVLFLPSVAQIVNNFADAEYIQTFSHILMATSGVFLAVSAIFSNDK